MRIAVRAILAPLLCAIAVFPLASQSTGRPPTLAIKAAHALDVRSGSYIDNAVVLLRGDRIQAVGSGLGIPAGVRVLDLGAATLLPGLIDAHAHLLLDLARGQSSDAEMIGELVSLGTTKRALRATKLAREVLEAGITTVRDLGNSGMGGDVALRDAIGAGWVIGPRIVASTRAISPPGGQYARMAPELQSLVAQEYIEISGESDARRAVKQALNDGADVIKIIVNGRSVMSLPEIKAIVEEAHLNGKRVAAHATDVYTTRLAVEGGVDSIEHGYSITDATLATMAQRGTVLVATDETTARLSAALKGRFDEAGVRAMRKEGIDRLTRARRAGVKVVAGSDAYYAETDANRGRASIDVLFAYFESGMTALEAIRSATLSAADLLGPATPVGVIEAGRFADFVAVAGDPLSDLTELLRPVFVMKGGIRVK